MPYTMNFDIYIKQKLDYFIFVLHIYFFLDNLEFQVNQENIHPTLTILKVVLGLKGVISREFKRINEVLQASVKLSENLWLSDDFRGNTN